jgi:hypothetical protein
MQRRAVFLASHPALPKLPGVGPGSCLSSHLSAVRVNRRPTRIGSAPIS